MLSIYIHSGYDHQGCILPFVLPIIASFESNELKRTNPNCSRKSLLIVALLVISWVFVKFLEVQWLQYMIMLAMLPSITAVCYGLKTTKILSYTFVCLLLFLPYGQSLFAQLQNVFASILVKIISIIHTATYWDGNNVYVGTNQYVISSMFISMQYMMFYLCIGSIFSAVFRRKLFSRIYYALLFGIIPFTALMCTFTALTIIKLPLKTDQLQLVGWAATLLSIIYIIRHGFRTKVRYYTNHDIDWHNAYPQRSAKLLTNFMLTMLLLIANNGIKHIELKPQYILANNNGYFSALHEWGQPIVINTEQDTYIAEYKRNKQSIFVTTKSTSLDTGTNQMLNSDWRLIKSQPNKINILSQILPITETIMQKDGISRITWTIQKVNGKYINDAKVGLFLEKLHTLQGHKISSNIISISTHVDTDLNAGRETLNNFLQDYMLK